MSIIAIAVVKTRFPRWQIFVKLDSSEDEATVDTRLQGIIDDADEEFAEYVVADSTTITGPLTLHLMNLIRKRCFDVKHGETAYETKPQIVRDYEASIEALGRYLTGLLEKPLAAGATDSQLDVSVTSRAKKFGDWFTGE